TVAGVTAASKVYDGTTTATLNTGSAALSGVLGSDVVALASGSATGSFATKAIGTGKAVTARGATTSGTDAGNYTLEQPTPTLHDALPILTVAGVTAASKVYDGTTTATLNTGSAALSGVLGSDVVALASGSATGSFATKTIGIG